MLVSAGKRRKIIIGNNIAIMIVDIQGDKSASASRLPAKVTVHREEVYQAIQKSRLNRSLRIRGRTRRPTQQVIAAAANTRLFCWPSDAADVSPRLRYDVIFPAIACGQPLHHLLSRDELSHSRYVTRPASSSRRSSSSGGSTPALLAVSR